MTITIKVDCNGCEATTEYSLPRPTIVQISQDYARILVPKIDEGAPEDWWIREPYTFCDYCPECTEWINSERE